MADDRMEYWKAMMQLQQQANNVFSSGLGRLSQFGQQIAMQPIPKKAPRKLEAEQTIVTAISGWRRWKVGLFDNSIRSFNEELWPVKAKLVATCKSGRCSGLDCSCGIYAWRERDMLRRHDDSYSQSNHIEGEVYLWGMVLECDEGWRGQFAYPKAFSNTGGLAQRYADIYGVPLL